MRVSPQSCGHAALPWPQAVGNRQMCRGRDQQAPAWLAMARPPKRTRYALEMLLEAAGSAIPLTKRAVPASYLGGSSS